MKYKIILVYITIIPLMFLACGEGTVSVSEDNYEPKIVIEGYLYPGKPLDGLKLTRNYPLNSAIDLTELILTDAAASITDLGSGSVFPLEFYADSLWYRCTDPGLQIVYGGEYQLDIAATVAGEQLTAQVYTKVPLQGFAVDQLKTTSEMIFHNEVNGILQKPRVLFERSPDTDFYAFSIVAVDAYESNFIYNHPWGGDFKKEDVLENLNDFRYSHDTVFNTPLGADSTEWEAEWFHFWFYGTYRIIAYAADENLKNYYLTHANVQEIDGNLHEPKFNIKGEGIGVFASVIADTIYLEITQP